MHYLLLIPGAGESVSCEHREQLASRTGLMVAHDTPEWTLLADSVADCLVVNDDAGVIRGKLFRRHGPPEQVRRLDDNEARRAVLTGGRHLVESFWGSYVAVFKSGTGISVLRDPSGGLACYYIKGPFGTALASDFTLFVDAGLITPEVDWDGVGRALYLQHLPFEKTAIRGVSQLLAGCVLDAGKPAPSAQCIWKPWDHIAEWPGEEPASERLGRIVRTTHRAWASCFAHPLVGLSGGLDSSIVAACLAGASAPITCITLSTCDPGGDERGYAREVSEAFNAPLIEAFHAIDAVDLDTSVAQGVPLPCGKLHEMAYNEAVREAVTLCGADGFFVGAGGDNVFYLTHSARPLVDRFRKEGCSRGTLSTFRDICVLTGASPWQVLREGMRVHRGRREPMQWKSDSGLLHPDFVAAQQGRPVEHPWLSYPDDTPPGRIGHVILLLRAMNHIEHRDKRLQVPMISPLLSQPVVELCLGIASWQVCEGGVDRAVARKAFARALPPKVASRHSKGTPEGFVAQFIEQRRPRIAERLLDGELARKRIVDRGQLETLLRPRGVIGPDDRPRLMALLDTEAWVRRWGGTGA
jgi:asparagine synthase (glutamine-hydrolysing)